MLTIKQALSQADDLRFMSDSWRLDAELLLADAMQTTREYLIAWHSQEIKAEKLLVYQEHLERRKSGEPIAYILGKKAFWDFELKVNHHVLIPRPETELLVETAIELLASHSSTSLKLADLGTGSGAIAIALARHNQHWQITAVDINADALAVARQNGSDMQLANIQFQLGSWCDGLNVAEYDMIVANPPYVAAGDSHLQQGDLVFEPSIALVSQDKGLSDICQIIAQSKVCLKKDAWLLMEHGFNQSDEVVQLLQQAGYSNIDCRQDYAGIDRMISAQCTG